MASSRTSFPSGNFYIQSSIVTTLVVDIETGFLKDPTKAGARLELQGRKPNNKANSTEIPAAVEQQLWRFEEGGYIANARTGHVLDIQGGK